MLWQVDPQHTHTPPHPSTHTQSRRHRHSYSHSYSHSHRHRHTRSAHHTTCARAVSYFRDTGESLGQQTRLTRNHTCVGVHRTAGPPGGVRGRIFRLRSVWALRVLGRCPYRPQSTPVVRSRRLRPPSPTHPPRAHTHTRTRARIQLHTRIQIPARIQLHTRIKLLHVCNYPRPYNRSQPTTATKQTHGDTASHRVVARFGSPLVC